ncbi:F-box/kelch-repeat protein At3g06240-like [Cornus florida]|uniref:F-box/kelch-repeat protein At3g06240-like n=1 Tax=Cornus florida TaxID=4283 RepID=UPI00289EF27F|nr:F-box/kelch-repeat protein At3g06240-like [Cornus florida]
MTSMQYRRYIDILLKDNPHCKWEIVGSCNGLICMAVDFQFIYIFNPSTREYKQIPDFDPSGVVGFGYDHCSDDYKLFKIHSNSIYAYSLRNCSWRKVHDFTYKSSVGASSNGIQLNGALHWLCLDEIGNPLEIAVFSLEDEKVWKIPIPIPMPTPFTDADEAYFLGVLEGCLYFRKFVLYYTREGTYRDLVFDDVNGYDAEIYVDSLVSPVM